MINRLMEKKRQQEGFTLIEMLIVVIILGILAAVVVFGVSTFREDSVDKACKTDVQSVETAAEAYRTKTGNYPQPVADDPATTATNESKTAIEVLVDNKYLKAAPDNTEYTIALDAEGDDAVATPAC